MDWKTFSTITASLFIALLGATLGFRYNRRLAARKDRLDRVNRQLSELYGPLLALTGATASAWAEFRNRYRPDCAYWSQDPPPTPEEQEAWRNWITVIFMPLNRRMMEVVVTKADLLDETDMPGCFLELCAHVASYEPILKGWERKDFAENTPFLPFPRPYLAEYVSKSFTRLKERQNALLYELGPHF